jgi:hypothetical protein
MGSSSSGFRGRGPARSSRPCSSGWPSICFESARPQERLGSCASLGRGLGDQGTRGQAGAGPPRSGGRWPHWDRREGHCQAASVPGDRGRSGTEPGALPGRRPQAGEPGRLLASVSLIGSQTAQSPRDVTPFVAPSEGTILRSRYCQRRIVMTVYEMRTYTLHVGIGPTFAWRLPQPPGSSPPRCSWRRRADFANSLRGGHLSERPRARPASQVAKPTRRRWRGSTSSTGCR